MEKLKIGYELDEWRLFIDGSKSGLKAVLLHNDGAYRPIPIAYSRTLKETHDSMKLIFEKVKYFEHGWDVSGDLKVVALIMGLQLGRTRNSCFICTWISTVKIDHYHATWEHRSEYIIGEMNARGRSLHNYFHNYFFRRTNTYANICFHTITFGIQFLYILKQ